MDKQKIFDQVLTHARTQNEKASSGIECYYRGPNNTKCFVGALIPDEMYRNDMENSNLSGDKLRPVRAHLGVETDEDEEFLKGLQRIHDNEHVLEWEGCLRKFAHDNELTFTELNTKETI